MTVYSNSISEKTSGVGINFNNKVAKNIRLENVSSLPSAGTAGRLVFNTSNNSLYVDNGSSWVKL